MGSIEGTDDGFVESCVFQDCGLAACGGADSIIHGQRKVFRRIRQVPDGDGFDSPEDARLMVVGIAM